MRPTSIGCVIPPFVGSTTDSSGISLCRVQCGMASRRKTRYCRAILNYVKRLPDRAGLPDGSATDMATTTASGTGPVLRPKLRVNAPTR